MFVPDSSTSLHLPQSSPAGPPSHNTFGPHRSFDRCTRHPEAARFVEDEEQTPCRGQPAAHGGSVQGRPARSSCQGQSAGQVGRGAERACGGGGRERRCAGGRPRRNDPRLSPFSFGQSLTLGEVRDYHGSRLWQLDKAHRFDRRVRPRWRRRLRRPGPDTNRYACVTGAGRATGAGRRVPPA